MFAFAPLRTVALSSALVALSACATSSPDPTPEPVEATEITLNLPVPEVESAQPESCACREKGLEAAENYFDRGVRALAAGDYLQAEKYFNRHRDEAISQTVREADVGLAFVALLSATHSDALVAEGLDQRAEVMMLALAAVQTLEGQIKALDTLNDVLAKDLKKREEALNRLRELTLGQEEG
ncbi:hypothetical protein NOR51B_2583 [Luminiphilus syltensis NOR5-1B]|uniref:DUF4398 domain-containing protein n=1 Tax=Luminiphilus syltensis NOR5-1B TaxID=565045 RepID=B8KXE2_9GAMM|nr:hypothetical protein NOR51B_2583 [Luminiphilus syltensis NOR5-1B]